MGNEPCCVTDLRRNLLIILSPWQRADLSPTTIYTQWTCTSARNQYIIYVSSNISFLQSILQIYIMYTNGRRLLIMKPNKTTNVYIALCQKWLRSNFLFSICVCRRNMSTNYITIANNHYHIHIQITNRRDKFIKSDSQRVHQLTNFRQYVGTTVMQPTCHV